MRIAAAFYKVSEARWIEDWRSPLPHDRGLKDEAKKEDIGADREADIGKAPCDEKKDKTDPFVKAGDEELTREAKELYGELKLPHRATKGSAGYDIYSPIDFELKAGEEILIATGMRCRMQEDTVLLIVPRSSLGFKYRFQLNNTVGVIDSDYFYTPNEGHIFIRFTNDSKNGSVLKIKKGQALAQGIFVCYGITEDDDAKGERQGGIGSTDR